MLINNKKNITTLFNVIRNKTKRLEKIITTTRFGCMFFSDKDVIKPI